MNKENKNRRRGIVAFTTVIWGYGECISMTSGRKPWMQRKREKEREREKSERGCNNDNLQDAQLSQRDRAAGCVI